MSLGIGANVLSRYIYLTSMEKPPTFTKIDDSSLIQIANRVGRDSEVVPYSFVYVNSLDADHVRSAMNTDPGSFTAPLKYDEIQKIMKPTCKSEGIIQKLKSIL